MDSQHAQDETREEEQSLWILTASPVIWSLHFLASYITAAIWCAKFAGPGETLGPVPVAIAVYTAVALTGIAIAGRVGYRRHSFGHATVPHDFDTPEDRHRFLGFATLLLSALSAVATVYVASVVIFIGDCN